MRSPQGRAHAPGFPSGLLPPTDAAESASRLGSPHRSGFGHLQTLRKTDHSFKSSKLSGRDALVSDMCPALPSGLRR